MRKCAHSEKEVSAPPRSCRFLGTRRNVGRRSTIRSQMFARGRFGRDIEVEVTRDPFLDSPLAIDLGRRAGEYPESLGFQRGRQTFVRVDRNRQRLRERIEALRLIERNRGLQVCHGPNSCSPEGLSHQFMVLPTLAGYRRGATDRPDRNLSPRSHPGWAPDSSNPDPPLAHLRATRRRPFGVKDRDRGFSVFRFPKGQSGESLGHS